MDPPPPGVGNPPSALNPLTRPPEVPLYGHDHEPAIKTQKDQLASISASHHGDGQGAAVEGNETRLYLGGGPKGAPQEQETDGREIWLDVLAATSILPPVHVVEAKSATLVAAKRGTPSSSGM